MTNQNIPSNTSTNNHTASVQPFGHLPLIDDDELSRLSPDSPAVTQHPSNDLQPSQNTSIIISPVSSSTLPISNHSSHQNHPTLHLEINHQPVMNRNIHNLHSDGDDDHEHEDEEDDEDGYSSSLAPSSSIPRTSLVADDHEDRYCFGSSAESESSSVGLIDFQTERNRLILKKRKKATLIPTNSTSLNSSANSTSISNTLTESNSSNSNNNYTSSPELIPLPYAGDDVDHPMFSSSSRSQPQSQPHSSVLHHSAGLYWTQNGLESSSSLSSRSSSSALSIGLIAPLHHHHHHHHHIHSLPTINNSSNITSSSNNSIGNQPVSSPSQPRDYLAPTPTPSRPPSRSSSSDRKLGRSTHEPLEIHHHQTIPIDFNDSRDHSHQFYNSHHLRTSAHSRKNPYQNAPPITTATHNPLLLHHHYRHHPMPNSYSQNLNSTNSNNSPHRSKRYWFSSRRQKRKNSIHALSATSSSSSASLYSPPFFSDQSASKLDDQAPKYSSLVSSSPNSGQPRRSSNGRLRRLSRFFPFILLSKLFSFRWFKKSISPYQPLGILLGTAGFIVFAISLTNFLIHFLDTDKEPLPWRSYCQEQPEFPHALADSLDPVNVFVGVFSIDSGYERRHLIRSTYARHSRPVDPRTGLVDHNVQLKFILGRPRIQHARRVALEMETYNDIVILDIAENMNRGKTFAYFSWASQNATVPFYYHQVQEPEPKTGINGIGGVKAHDPNNSQNLKLAVGFKKADFVVKADDDAFIVLSELERHLRVAPRTKTYWGYLIRNLFMGGECYALSSDLVRYVATSERVLDHLTGAEDKKVAKWMRIHPNATQINWVTERCWIYDHPKAGTTYSHGFLFPDEVERVRAEGRRGLTEAEIEERGEANLQSYSTVAKWKQRYVAPKNMMTMEEEVEALVEGGGRFQSSSLKRPVMPSKDLVPAEKVVFEADDQRLKKSNSITNKSTTKGLRSRVEEMGHYNEPVKNHYEEPSLKFGRPPSELMAHMPELENMPESELKEALIKARESKIVSKEEKFQKGSVGTVKLAEMPSQTQGVADSLSGTMLFAPTLRYDPDDIRLRNQRYLNRPHGGTVVVHYLKRNEWFLETSLVLLGKTKTWDDGLVPGAYGPHLREPSEKAKGTVVLGLDNMEDGSNQSSLTALGSKKVEVDNKIDWGKLNEVEEVPAGAGVFGGARMYGSPVILADGRIKEGRVISPSQRAIAETDFKVRQKMTDGDYRDSELGKASNTLEIVEDEEEEEGLKNIDGIRKSQFGGAGWIRGKPRVRVGDPANGPNFDLIKDQPESETNRGEEDGQRKDSVEEDSESNFEGINEEVAETQEVLKQILLKPTSIGGGSVVRSASELYNGVKVKS